MAKPGRPKSDLRDRLIQAGMTIFSQKSFQSATVEAVIESLGVSKGGFYHHFSSKEELFDAVVDQMAAGTAERIRAAAARPGLNALEKFNLVLAASRGLRLSNAGLMREIALGLERPENAPVRTRLRDRSRALIAPPLAELIDQGRSEGLFNPLEVLPTAELLVDMAAVARRKSAALLAQGDQDGQTARLISENINFHLEAMERLLAAPPQSLNRVAPDRVQVFVEAYLSGQSRPES